MDSNLPAISNLAEALSKAQGEIKAPLKNRKVDFTDKNGRRVNYSYADLADLIEAIKGPLSKAGLSVTHQLEYDNGAFGMRTSLMHVSGEDIATWYPLPNPGELRPQEFGSEITYARRYSLSCLLGVASEEDDDGELAAPTPRANAAPPTATPRPAQGPTAPQIARLFAIAKSTQWPAEAVKDLMMKEFGIDSTSKLNREQYDKLTQYLAHNTYVAQGPASTDPEDVFL